MYQVGDVVVYENMGVCEVTDLSEQQVGGCVEPQLYYTLKPIFQECDVHTPVNNRKVFMRPVITKEEAEQLIEMIPTIRVEPYYNKANGQLVEHYTSSLKSHNCLDLMELTMSIYAKKQEMEEQNRKFGVVDERFMRRAEELLFGELSVALGIEKNEVSDYIAAKVDALDGETPKAV